MKEPSREIEAFRCFLEITDCQLGAQMLVSRVRRPITGLPLLADRGLSVLVGSRNTDPQPVIVVRRNKKHGPPSNMDRNGLRHKPYKTVCSIMQVRQ